MLIMCVFIFACATNGDKEHTKERFLVVCFMASCRVVLNDRAQVTKDISQDGKEAAAPFLRPSKGSEQ